MSIKLRTMPKILGIVNLTPDSFSDGGDYNSVESAITRAIAMLEAGVDALDLGGESTRPGSLEISIDEELSRVLPTLTALIKRYPEAVISVDTRKGEVAKEVLKAGATIINDVSMLEFDPKLVSVVAEFPKTKLVIGHTKGTPESMSSLAVYDSVVNEVCRSLTEKAKLAESVGIRSEDIILDPGLGFAKNSGHNLEILNSLTTLNECGYPIMIGHSRKRFIGEICELATAKERDAVTLALSCALIGKVEWLRVHNAVDHANSFKLLQYIN